MTRWIVEYDGDRRDRAIARCVELGLDVDGEIESFNLILVVGAESTVVALESHDAIVSIERDTVGATFGDAAAKNRREWFREWTDFDANDYHPLAWISGDVEIGAECYIGFFSVIHAVGASIAIGNGCDIAPFAILDVADSHRKTIGWSAEVERKPISIGAHTFIGTHAAVLPGVKIGQHSAIGAGEIVRENVPSYSLVVDGEVKRGYYENNGVAMRENVAREDWHDR